MPRIVSVGDDFALPAGTKVLDSHLPARLGSGELSATIDTQVSATVPPLVNDAIANDPTVAAAAAGLAQSDAGLVKKTDPGIPQDVPMDEDTYASATTDSFGRIAFGVRNDGAFFTQKLAQAGYDVSSVASTELLRGTIDASNRVAEDALGPDGRVPPAVLAAWKSRMGLTPTLEPYDLIVIAGQSNATQADTLAVTVEDVDPRIFRWNATSGTIEQLPATSTYLGADFARNYARTQPPGRRVLIVDAAVGATGFSTTSISPAPEGYHTQTGGTWDRTLTADPKNLYTIMMTKTAAALTAAGTNARLVAMLWSQGEDDVWGPGLTQAQYAAKFDDLATTARTTWGNPTLPIIVGSMVPEVMSTAPYYEVNRAHVDTPRRLEGTAFVYGPENVYRFGDTIHYSAQGQRVRGRMFADALYTAKANRVSVKPIHPSGLRVTRSGDTASVAWDFPPCRVTAFTLEYSTDDTNWTPVTLEGPLFTKATITVPATSRCIVRVRTTNELGTTFNSRKVYA